MARPHIKEFEALPTHQMSRLERDSSRRMIRECSRMSRPNAVLLGVDVESLLGEEEVSSLETGVPVRNGHNF